MASSSHEIIISDRRINHLSIMYNRTNIQMQNASKKLRCDRAFFCFIKAFHQAAAAAISKWIQERIGSLPVL